MIFWIAVAVLAAAVTYAVARPLLQDTGQSGDGAGGAAAHPPTDPARADLAVYRDQLEEVDADRDRGVISNNEADAARAEIARRLIRRAERSRADGLAKPAGAVGSIAQKIFVASSLALPLASLGLYLNFGSPGLPAQPLSERLAASTTDAKTNDLVAKVEEALRKNPQDGRGWDVIAPVYMALNRFDDAAAAYASAMRLVGESAQRLQGFADARIQAENGLVPDDARGALIKLLASDASLRQPRLWLALAKEQDGDRAGASADYRDLIKDAPADAPWRIAIAERLKRLEDGPALTPKANAAGTSDGEVAAPSTGTSAATKAETSADVAAMSPEQRNAMINSMVDGLATRLKTEKSDLVGWQKLIRAYQVLGRTDDVRKAISEAEAGLAGDEKRLTELREWVKQLGPAG